MSFKLSRTVSFWSTQACCCLTDARTDQSLAAIRPSRGHSSTCQPVDTLAAVDKRGRYAKAAKAPEPELLNDLIGTALKIEARTAALYGLDAPTKQQIVATAVVGASLSEEELDRRLDRLTEEERHDYIRLSIKMEGRGADAEPQPAENEAALPHPKSRKSRQSDDHHGVPKSARQAF